MGDRLTTIDMGQKVGAAVLVSVGELGPHNTVSPAPIGLPPYHGYKIKSLFIL